MITLPVAERFEPIAWRLLRLSHKDVARYAIHNQQPLGEIVTEIEVTEDAIDAADPGSHTWCSTAGSFAWC